jgi:hypothetical protein
VPMLLAEVTRAREAAATVEASHVAAVLVTETSAWEATMAWESIIAHVKDVEDRATLAKRVAQERVSKMEVESITTLVSAREKVEGLV